MLFVFSGTHVAGSAAGSIPGEDDGTFHGAAPDAKLAFFDVGNSHGMLMIPTDFATFFNPLYAAGARVFTNSWGATYSSFGSGYSSMSRSVDLFMKTHPDALVIFAAGNSGSMGPRSVMAPATNKNGLAVGASLNSAASWAHDGGGASLGASEDQVAFFSSVGPTADGRMKPDILAPGKGR